MASGLLAEICHSEKGHLSEEAEMPDCSGSDHGAPEGISGGDAGA